MSINTSTSILRDLTYLKEAHSSSLFDDKTAVDKFNKLPTDIQNTIKHRIKENAMVVDSHGIKHGVERVIIEKYAALSPDSKSKTHRIFYRYFCKSGYIREFTSYIAYKLGFDEYWAKHHIRDENKIDFLFRSLSSIYMKETINDWAGNDLHKQEAKKRIIEFISCPNEVELDFFDLKLDSFPDICDSLYMTFNLQAFYFNPCDFTTTPALVKSLRNLLDSKKNEINKSNYNILSSLANQINDTFIIYKARMWAGNNTNRCIALEKIKTFLKCKHNVPLDLSNLELDSLPDGIFDHSKMKCGLTCLFLHNNRLSVLPDSIGNLSNLRQLSLSDNSLEILPQAITNLKYLQHLEINNNRLLTIPDNIGNLEELKQLHLNKNQLQTLPNSIGDLKKLDFLMLKKNPITSAPSSILNLSRCTITLDYSQEIVTVLRTHTEQLDETNRSSIPAIDFDDDDAEELPVTTINESLKDLYLLVQRDNFSNYETNYPNISRCIQDENLHSNLKEWLSRFRFMIINSIQNKDLLAKKILSYLDFAEKDDAFRDKFFGIIEEAATTCGDRMALSILYLGLTLNLATFNKTDLKGYAHFLIHGPWIVDMLEKIAQSKIDTLKNIDKVDEEKIDPIEVYLAYPVKLKEKLNIQIDVEDMLYFKCSGVTDQDLDSAEKTIKEMLEAPDAIATILVQRKDWVEALSVEYQSDMDAFKRQRDSELEALTTYDEHSLSLIENVFLQNILDLTKKALANF